MADEHNTAIDGKVEFTPEQQEKVNDLIKKAMGRAASDLRAENESIKSQLTSLQTELATAKSSLSQAKTPEARADAAADVAALQSQIAQMKDASKATQDEAKRWQDEAKQKQKEVDAAKDEVLRVRKDVAITTAASKINFVNVDVVRKLTEDQIKWSDEYKQFVVLAESGGTRLDATLEKPMTLEHFFNDFAAKNKYLVRGDINPGTGSSESARNALSRDGKFEVTQIFGPKSSSRLANELARSNPQEYKRLKTIARSAGLVA
jgi:hypothetical protein